MAEQLQTMGMFGMDAENNKLIYTLVIPPVDIKLASLDIQRENVNRNRCFILDLLGVK